MHNQPTVGSVMGSDGKRAMTLLNNEADVTLCLGQEYNLSLNKKNPVKPFINYALRFTGNVFLCSKTPKCL